MEPEDVLESLTFEWRTKGVRDADQWLAGLIGGEDGWRTVAQQVFRCGHGANAVPADLIARTNAFIESEMQHASYKQQIASGLPAVSTVPVGTIIDVDDPGHNVRTRYIATLDSGWQPVPGSDRKYAPYEPPTVTELSPKDMTANQREAIAHLREQQREHYLATLRSAISRVSSGLRAVARQHDMAIDSVEYACMLLSKIQPALDAVQEQVTKSHRQRLDLGTSEGSVGGIENGLMSETFDEE